jgi:hypothetical protein
MNPSNTKITKQYSSLQWARMERRGKAYEHDQEMETHYIFSDSGNYRDEKGYRKGHPLPYSDKYPMYFFLSLFRRKGESFIIDHLEKYFVGDEADAFYIEELFIEAEELGLFIPNTVCIFLADGGRICYPPVTWLGHPQSHNQNTVFGSEINIARREIVNRWLALRMQSVTKLDAVAHLSTEVTGNGLASQATKITLEDICKGSTEVERKVAADRIDAIWKDVKAKTPSEDDHSAACVAVYKLVEWLGMIAGGIAASEWKPALQPRYGISISEGVGKYNIENPKSGVFKKAVKLAFIYVRSTYPTWTANKGLPVIYQ